MTSARALRLLGVRSAPVLSYGAATYGVGALSAARMLYQPRSAASFV